MNIFKTYLCGPILNCSDEQCIDWRKDAAKNISNTLDPMIRDYRSSHKNHVKEIVEEDKKMIDESRVILVKFDFPSVGTIMEILYGWERGKIIVTIIENSNITVSPWLKYHSDYIVNSLEDGYSIINMIKNVKELDKFIDKLRVEESI